MQSAVLCVVSVVVACLATVAWPRVPRSRCCDSVFSISGGSSATRRVFVVFARQPKASDHRLQCNLHAWAQQVHCAPPEQILNLAIEKIAKANKQSQATIGRWQPRARKHKHARWQPRVRKPNTRTTATARATIKTTRGGNHEYTNIHVSDLLSQFFIIEILLLV